MRALTVLPLAVLGGCGIVAPDSCNADDDCRAAFGWGHSCGDRGQCEVLEPTDLCSGSWPSGVWDDRDAYRQALVVGTIVDTSLFPLERDAVRLAVDQVNDLGGIDGHEIALLECDSAGLEEEARSAALQEAGAFLSSGAGVEAIVGPVTSADTAVVAPMVGDAVVISPGGGGLSLVNVGAVWRAVPSDADLAQSIVRSMIEDGLGPAVVVHSNDLAQTELARSFADTILLASTEYPALSAELYAFGSATERNARIVDAAYADADVVVMLSEDPQDYVDMLLAASAIDEYQDLLLFVGPAAYRPALLSEASAASALFPNLRGVRSATRVGAVADVFRASFTSAFGGQDPDESGYTGQAYDSAWSAFSAMLWSGMRYGRVDGFGVSEGMANLSFGLPLSLGPSGWTGLVEAFAEAGSVDLDGASSPLDFDVDTRAIRGPVGVWAVEGDGFVTIREFAY